MVKKPIVLLVCIVIIISLTACGFRKKMEAKITEGITEGIINKVIGDDAKIDLDEGKLTLKGNDGEEVVFGSTEWPEGMAADLIPKLKKGTIITSANTNQGCMIVLQDIEEKDYKEYIEMLTDKGFTEDKSESSSEDYMTYFASLNDSKKRATVGLAYTPSGKELSISLSVE